MGLFVHFVDIQERKKERKKNIPIYRVAAQLKFGSWVEDPTMNLDDFQNISSNK